MGANQIEAIVVLVEISTIPICERFIATTHKKYLFSVAFYDFGRMLATDPTTYLKRIVLSV